VSSRHTPPLVVFGLDVGDGDLIRRWAGEGRMPTIASLLKNGTNADLGGPEYLTEHGTWVPLLSGRSRAQHGYHYFRQLKAFRYELERVTGSNLDVEPFWARLPDDAGAIATIDVPDFDPLPDRRGIQITNLGNHQPTMTTNDARSVPVSLLARAREIYGPSLFTPEFDPLASVDDDRRTRDELLDRVARKGRVCRSLFAEGDFRFVCAVFSELHPAGHRLWKYRRAAKGDGPNADDNDLCNGLRDVYEAIDREFESILAVLPSEANVVLLATTGMVSHYPTYGINDNLCRVLGYQVDHDSVSPRAAGLRRLLAAAIPKAWHARRYARVPEDERERRLSDEFHARTDWGQTTAFTIPSMHAGLIRINLAGREPHGIVRNDREYDSMVERICADVAEIVDPETGKRAVRRIVPTAREFGERGDTGLPDIVIEWEPAERFIERLEHPRGILTQERPLYYPDSYHELRGFLVASGPDIRVSQESLNMDALDVAPTLLSLLGAQEKLGDLRGRVRDDLIVRA
jgi:predicted AlkP superfamily phosphohydrolase/phosphomutase